VILVATVSPAAAQDAAKVLRFSKQDVGKAPTGWKVTQTNEGKGSVWQVMADGSAPSKSGFVLAQTADSPSKVFNLCIADGIADGTKLKDVELVVHFKAVKGDTDQGGGLVWRYRDEKNYYVARMNPLESNFRLYKVVEGKRIQLGSKDKLKVPTGEWHRIKIKHVGKRIECFLDDEKVLDEEDGTLAEAGLVGLWTKADAYTYFDGLRIGPPDRKE
jgi:hypothetical protein